MTKRLADWIIRMGGIDRRVIFVIVGLSVLLPLLWPLSLPVRPTKASKDVFDAVEALPRGSKVLMSFDYGPNTKPEIHPMAVAMLRHLLRRDHKLYVMCLWPDGLFMAEEALALVAEGEFGLVRGEDYVFLGFRPGNEAVVKGVVSDIRKLYTIDAGGTLVDEIPMMQGINKFADFDYLFAAAAGYPGTPEWVQYAADPTGVPMSAGTTSIQVNEVMPYVQAGQMQGILAGMPGAAEYEALIGRPWIGISGMDAQSIAHVVIVGFIIFGNIGHYLQRKRGKPSSTAGEAAR